MAVFKEERGGLIYCALWELDEVSPGASLALGYGCVSMALQSRNHSLATQIRHELELAAQRGHVLRYLYIDAGVTGRDDRRPAFVKMMRRATAGDMAALYVYDLFRFYRNLQGLTTYYSLLQQHQTNLISTADRDTDFSTGDGKLLLQLKGMIAERFLDDLSRTTRDNKLSRAMKGLSNASWPPFGYCRGHCLNCTDPNGEGYCPHFGQPDLWREPGGDPKVFMPHPIEQVAMQLAAGWYATGRYSDTDIAEMLNAYRYEVEPGCWVPFWAKGQPGRDKPARPFHKDGIREMLQNPYYAGYVVYRPLRKHDWLRFQGGKRLNPYGQTRAMANDQATTPGEITLFLGQHIPLIELSLFEQCLQIRGARGYVPSSDAKRTARVYPLTGILRCERDGGTFRGNAAHGNLRYYEDVERVQGASKCPIRAIRAEALEEPVFAHVQQLRVPPEWYPDILAYGQQSEADSERRRQQRSLETQLRTVQTQHQSGELSRSEYVQLRRRLDRQMQQLSRQEQAGSAAQATLLADFPRLWAAATPLERKTLLGCIFLDIHVLDGKITGYTPRDPFVPLFPAA